MASDARPENTGYTPGEDSNTRWRNWFSLLTGQMTDEGKEQYRKDRDIRHEETDCKRCEKYRDHLLKYSETLLFTVKREAKVKRSHRSVHAREHQQARRRHQRRQCLLPKMHCADFWRIRPEIRYKDMCERDA